MDKIEQAVWNSTLNAIRLLLLLFLSCGFLGLGMLKLVSSPEIIAYFNAWEIPQIWMYIIGAFELILSAAVFYFGSRKVGSLGIMIFMIGVSLFHTIKQDYGYLPAPIIIMFAAFILWRLTIYFENKK